MDKFLDAHNQPKLNQGDVIHLTSTITCNETEAVIKSHLPKKSPGPDGFTTKFNQTFKQELMSIIPQTFQEIERERTIPNTFYEAKIT
jgi:hypothetical protein